MVMFPAGVYLLLFFCGWSLVECDPIDFFPYYDDSELLGRSFGEFSGFQFQPLESPQFGGNMQYQESSNIPIYTDGAATPQQVTLSQLEKNYKSQLRHIANQKLHARAELSSHVSSAPSPTVRTGRKPIYPTQGTAHSFINERRYTPKQKSTPVPSSSTRVPSIHMETGFVPIIPGVHQDKRHSSQSLASTVIKDVKPPILKAASNSLPTSGRSPVFRSAASTESASKAAPFQNSISKPDSQPIAGRVPAVSTPKPRQANFSRAIIFPSSKKAAIGSSFSESVVSRTVIGPSSVQGLQQKEQLRAVPSGLEDSRVPARKEFDFNCDSSRDLGWCELGHRYPKKMVDEIVELCKEAVNKMHVELPHSFEKLSDTSNFKAELQNGTREAKERGSHDAWSWAAYFHQGALCEAETGFLRPETARDSAGKWNLIVQTDSVKQRVPIEMCRQTNSSCKKMLNCGLKSQCLQKYNYHMLLSLNPSDINECPFMKLYRFPSACVCHVE